MELSWVRYRLPLKQPLVLAHGVVQEREGILLNFGNDRYGDACPLPGFSDETVDDVAACLLEGVSGAQWPASLRWAMAQAEEGTLQKAVRVNALWVPASESLPQFLDRTRAWPALTVKIKISADGLERQIHLLNNLQAARPETQLRLDPNRSLSVDQLLALHAAVKVEYFEEPLVEPSEYVQLWEKAPVPVALDESLLDAQLRNELINAPFVKALVVKPTLLGAPKDWSWAKDSKKSLVLSSCFESGVGLWNLAALASELSPDVASGLDTNHWLRDDLVLPRPSPEKGLITDVVWGLTDESLHLFD